MNVEKSFEQFCKMCCPIRDFGNKWLLLKV